MIPDLRRPGLVEGRSADWALNSWETSLASVFAVSDVRSGSVKRAASAVGEGWCPC